jgi:hypothetical protein
MSPQAPMDAELWAVWVLAEVHSRILCSWTAHAVFLRISSKTTFPSLCSLPLLSACSKSRCALWPTQCMSVAKTRVQGGTSVQVRFCLSY